MQIIGYVSPKLSCIDAAPYSNIFPAFIIQIMIWAAWKMYDYREGKFLGSYNVTHSFNKLQRYHLQAKKVQRQME